MPAAGAIRAGRAFVELFADDKMLVRGLKSAQRQLKAFGTSVTAMGKSLFAAGSLATLPLIAAGTVFTSFESQMSRVKALTNATEKQFQQLADKAKELGKDTVFSASQAAEAMSYFALAGFNTDQILSAIGPTLDLAAAGQIEIAQAADIAAKIMAGMGMSADELGGAVDVMAKAMSTANTDIAMLGEAFKFVGPMAKTAGISLEEITAAIQLLSNAGVQGEMAGTTLRGMILSLTAPSAEAAAELERLGVNVLDSAKNVRPLVDIIADLESALAGTGSGEKLKSLGTIFPARQAAGAAELVAQGADRLRQATRELGSSTGTAARIASTQLDNLKGDVTILLSALEAVAIAFGESVGPMFRIFTQGSTQLLANMADWIEQNQQVAITIVSVIAGTLAAGAGLVALGVSATLASFVFGGLAMIVTGFGAAVGAAATVVGLLLSPLTVLTAVGAALGTILGAIFTPLGLVVTGIAALAAYSIASGDAVAWLTETFGPLGEFAMETFDAIKTALQSGDFSAAADILWKTLQLAWVQGIAELEKLWLGFRDFILDAWTTVTSSITDSWDSLQTFLAQGMVSLFVDDPAMIAEAQDQLQSDLEQRQQGRTNARNQAILAREQARDERVAELEAQIATTRGAQKQAINEARTPRQVQLQTSDGQRSIEQLDLEGLLEGAQLATSPATQSQAFAGTFSSLASLQFTSGDKSTKQEDLLQDVVNGIADVNRNIQEVLSYG